MLKPLGHRGDTIVEVLIVLAILGLAISISYATASRSLLGARQAQEHSEALELLQGQIEQLRAVATSDDSIYLSANHQNGFCMYHGVVTDLPDPNCTMSNLYDISVNTDDNDLFTFQATWSDVTGSGTDNVSLAYRVHKNDF